MIDLRPFYRPLAPSTRSTYRVAWRVWRAWCDSVGLDPLKVNVPQAQQWIDSMKHQGIGPNLIRRHCTGVRQTLEYHSMVGVRGVYEPFAMVDIPKETKRVGILPGHEPLTDQRIAQALYDTRNTPRAHAGLWACAGMGLTTAELARLTPERVKRVGAFWVAITQRRGKAELIPCPRELVRLFDPWPFPSKTPVAARQFLGSALNPYLKTSPMDLYTYHRELVTRLDATPSPSRFSFSEHPALIVCAHLRQNLIDFAERSAHD